MGSRSIITAEAIFLGREVRTGRSDLCVDACRIRMIPVSVRARVMTYVVSDTCANATRPAGLLEEEPRAVRPTFVCHIMPSDGRCVIHVFFGDKAYLGTT